MTKYFCVKKENKSKMALLTNSASATGPSAGGPTAPQAHSATPLHHYFHYLKQPSPLAQNPYAHHSSAHHMGMGPGPLGGLGPFGLTPHGLEAVGFPQGKASLELVLHFYHTFENVIPVYPRNFFNDAVAVGLRVVTK